jgi:hypothetical protein
MGLLTPFVKVANKILFILGVANIAAHSLSNLGFTDCGGLFLLHTSDKQFSARQCGFNDQLEVQNLKIYGDLRHITYQGRYTDQWDVKGFNSLDIASIGFESEFKYITLGIDVSSLPFVKSTLAVHSADNFFRISTSIARGSVELGNIRWISENKDDIVPEISVDWETHLLARSISAEINPGIHHFGISGNYLQSSPENTDKEYYIRDSISVMIARGEYGAKLGQSHLSLEYSYVNADIYLYGIFHHDASYKRFMYVPLDAQLHRLLAQWNYKNLKTNLNYVHVAGKIEANQDRFFETLAPNRALHTSVLKSLSFSFLQKMFRVDADLDAMGIFGGTEYQWHLGRKYSFNPRVIFDGYYASGAIDMDKQIETLVLLTYNKQHEIYRRELKSAGGILSLGAELRREGPVTIVLDYSVTQLVPVYSSYKEFLPGESNGTDDGNNPATTPGSDTPSGNDTPVAPEQEKKSGDLETEKGVAFRNGFATHLGITVRF